MKMDDLTPRQRDVFDYIIVYREQNGIAPTIREICRYLGLSSPGGIAGFGGQGIYRSGTWCDA